LNSAAGPEQPGDFKNAAATGYRILGKYEYHMNAGAFPDPAFLFARERV
jgi:hypothetical protein